MTLARTPAITELSGYSPFSTESAPTIHLFPLLAPGKIVVFKPT